MRANNDERLTVRAPDGRVLDVLAYGPEDGLALVFHTGTPNGLVEFGPVIGAATARGLRTVLYSRPGQGHLTLMAKELGSIFDDLLDLAGKSGRGQAVAD